MTPFVFRGSFVAALAVAAPSALADSGGKLQGAWVMLGTECAQTFDLSGPQPKLLDRHTSTNTGIIISGATMTGPMSICRIGRINEGAEGLFRVHLQCADSIMFSDITVTLSLTDERHFSRIDPDFPEIAQAYQKCP